MPMRLAAPVHSMLTMKVGFTAILGTALLFVSGTIPGGDNSVNVLIATTIVGFLTMIVQQWFNVGRDKRNRQYDLEDRKAHTEEQNKAILASAALLAEQNKAAALALQQRVEQNLALTRQQAAITNEEAATSRQKITALLEENTAATLQIKQTLNP